MRARSVLVIEAYLILLFFAVFAKAAGGGLDLVQGFALPAEGGLDPVRSFALTKLSTEQIYSFFNQANESFRQANSITDDIERAQKLYEKSVLLYEKIIDDGQIKNAKLYYNLANAYLLKGDIGRAILNYRRAERLDSSDSNIKKNLTFARSQRIDKIQVKAKQRVLQTLFFWHYDFALKTKFILTYIFYGTFCIALTVTIWFGRNAPSTVTAVVAGILMPCFLVSVILQNQSQSRQIYGVITSEEVVARQGDGQNYPASFKEPLHEGTEFDLLERRPEWFHIQLANGSDGWIPDNSAKLI